MGNGAQVIKRSDRGLIISNREWDSVWGDLAFTREEK